MSARTFDTLLESAEADINAIPVVRSEQLFTCISGNIPVSGQELVYSGKAARVVASSQLVDMDNELLPSSKKFLGQRNTTRTSEGLDTNFLQRTCPKDKSLVEKPKLFFRGPEESVGPKEQP
ncbi:hypothetical protein O181_013852 [Austropuccinia psidii MF-1]|uniref:Uncharacterized protein n=1 Tax=Austropuccinia psidii MF-1 TaxID=1389203 RepID=A0A9Q3C0I8_9BASI|nr:hypothetical protein [Austropuccinia psidii MF-1]